jgi:hypothetical protein
VTSNINEIGLATRFRPGQSGNPGGRPKSTITARIRDILDRPSDLYEAVRIIEQAEGTGAAEKWDVESLTNGDLIALALVGVALNRSGTVPPNVQLSALQYLTDRMDGKLTDKTPGALTEDDSNRPLMTVEQFREAVMFKPETQTVQPDGQIIDDAEQDQ